MYRESQIKDKLKYAWDCYEELMSEMFQTQDKGLKLKYISHKAGNILSTSRECFDYCSKDIVEKFIIPISSKSNAISNYNSGKLKVYFPFYKTQLTNAKNIFSELSKTYPALYHYLFDLTLAIEKDEVIPETMMGYREILEVQEMVNQKKHDRIISVDIKKNGATLININGTRMTISSFKTVNGKLDHHVQPRKVSSDGWTIPNRCSVKDVPEYLFELNNKEVGRFCITAVRATEKVLGKIYENFFLMPKDYFKVC